MNFDAPSPKELLHSELQSRMQKNPSYSLRSFAKLLAMEPARLSELISGKSGLSPVRAAQLADRLGYQPDEKRYFIALAESCHARNAKAREEAETRLREFRDRTATQLQLDAYQTIADWYHFAILELTSVKGFQSDPAWIAQTLGINILQAKSAINALLRLGLLKSTRNNTLVADHEVTFSPNGVPSEALRQSHRQLLTKAIEALEKQSIQERNSTAMIFAIRKAAFPEAIEDLKKFRRKFARKYCSQKDKDEVYALSIQLFRLT